VGEKGEDKGEDKGERTWSGRGTESRRGDRGLQREQRSIETIEVCIGHRRPQVSRGP
jgi:hypothetical protein